METTQETVDMPPQQRGANNNPSTQRINIPLNLDNWLALPESVSAELLWLHQWILDSKVTWQKAEQALAYDRSTIFRVLKGTYEGSWENVVDHIRSFRKLVEKRLTITRAEFAHNGITKLIWAGIDYAIANNSITLIVGESRMGKSAASLAWKAANHGVCVYVEVPPVGGTRALMMEISDALGINKNQSIDQMRRCIIRAFNPNRILILDEVTRLLDCKNSATSLELIRHIHDRTNCAIALIATARFEHRLKAGTYQFEQVLGRIGMPIRLKREITLGDILPIVTQYLENPAPGLLKELHRIANERGRLGVLVETLKVASRMAAKKEAPLNDHFVMKAIALRKQMSGN